MTSAYHDQVALDRQQRQIERDLAWERQLVDDIELAADQLLAATLRLGRNVERGNPYWAAGSSLYEAALRNGYDPHGPYRFEQQLKDIGWPSSQHLRLHFLADRDGGWLCYRCRAGLVDVCSDDDMDRDESGGRMIRESCGKELPAIDHVVPRQLNGSNHPQNQRLTCVPCNSSKGAS